MTPQEATREQLETALSDIIKVMYSCRQCGQPTCDDSSTAAQSAADLVDVVDSVLWNQNLAPAALGHDQDCEYSSN